MEHNIPEEIIDEIRLKADIVDTISDYVPLQRKGKNYLGLCPFHGEKTPSFNVNQEKQMFYCFGCHTGGNVFSFLMKKENWTFLEAVKFLAEKNGVSLPEKKLSGKEKEEQRQRDRWEEIHELATSYFHEILTQKPLGEPGRKYFKTRGIDEAVITAFRLGYAPDGWDGLLNALSEKGIKAEELVDAGLALKSEKKWKDNEYHFYDRFRNRIIFSILDHRNRPIAFGGRVLDDSLPKYLNSPETKFFNKGHHLYGMHKAHQGIREVGFALLVEGYMDVIALQKAGFVNAVASLGTALTKDQAKLLRRYTQRVVVCYDADSAGLEATIRAGEILRDIGLQVDVLTVRNAKDPDEFIQTHGVEEFRKLLDQVLTYFEFKYKTLIERNDPQNIRDKAELVASLAPDLIKVKSPVEREGYERFLSLELGLTLEAVQREIESIEQKKPKNKRENQQSAIRQDNSVKNRDNIIRYVNADETGISVSTRVFRAERILLRLILEDPNLLMQAEEELGMNFWQVNEHQVICQYLTSSGLRLQSTDLPESIQSFLAALLMDEINLDSADQLFKDCIRGIKSDQAEESLAELQNRMASLEKSGDLAGAMVLLREIGERLRRGEK